MSFQARSRKFETFKLSNLFDEEDVSEKRFGKAFSLILSVPPTVNCGRNALRNPSSLARQRGALYMHEAKQAAAVYY